MPRASQDYSDTDYGYIKRAAALTDCDVRSWIATQVVAAAKQAVLADATALVKELALPATSPLAPASTPAVTPVAKET